MRISDAFQSIVAAYNDWGNFLINPRYMRNDNEVMWIGRLPGIRKSIIRESHIIEMADTGQYTFQIVDDGSLLQLYYKFDHSGDQLVSANLAFYRAKSESEPIDEDILMSEIGVMPVDDQEKPLDQETNLTVLDSVLDQPVGWLRIDYDPGAKERGVIHHDCHIHMSSFPNTRFIVSGVPAPRQFIEFVIAASYPEKYKKRCLALEIDEQKATRIWKYADDTRIKSVNSLCVPLEENPVYNQLSHFRIPSSS